MGRGIRAVVLAALCAAVLATPAEAGRGRKLTAAERDLEVESFDVVWTTIRDKHYDPALGGLDWEAIGGELRPRIERARTRAEARGVLRDLVGRLRQSHFQIIPAEVLEDMAQEVGEGSAGGDAGIDARVVGGKALVTSVAKGSPAERAGVLPGWEILRIGKFRAARLERIALEFEGRPHRELVLADAVLARLSGRIGERVTVRFRDGAGRPVRRDLVLAETRGARYRFGHVSNLHVWIETKRLEGNVGYVAFNGFLDPARVMPAFDEAMRSFLDAKGIVLDLRGNGGGMIPMAMGMAGWLIPEGDRYLGTLKLRETELKAIVSPRPETFAGPVAVLVDGLSVSCAEVLAGGLQDLGRARVFGTRTAGMVLGSSIEKLPSGDGFQYVFAGYVTSGGRKLEGAGVVPDVVAPPDRKALLAGGDPALDAASSWILRHGAETGEKENR